MRIAIFHNYMDNIGGAEMVVLTLARELKADVYTTVANQENIKRMGFDVRVHTIGWIPKNAPWRQQLALFRLRWLNISDQYDFFIIAGDWAISAAVNHKPNLWYVHSPIREIYDLREYVRKNLVPKFLHAGLNRLLFDLWVSINRYLNAKYVNHAERITCNSRNTQKRVQNFLHKEASVTHPPTDTSLYHFGSVGDYWLSVNRLVPPKRIEVQLEAFAKMPNEKLIVVGSYEKSTHFLTYKKYIEKLKPKNVEMLSHIDAQRLRELYANCKGFITTAIDEDFGLTPVEAMASGKPVIAPAEGGYLETVIDGETGVLLDKLNAEELRRAIIKVGQDPLLYKEACLKRAKQFDTTVFIEKIKREIGI